MSGPKSAGPDQAATREPAHWRATNAFAGAVLFVGIVLLLAVFTGRPDLALLAAPVAVATAIGMWQRPTATPTVTLDVATSTVGEGGELQVNIDVTNRDTLRYDLVVARIAVDPWLRLDTRARPFVAALAAGETTSVAVTGRALRWGRQPIGPVHLHAIAADGLLISPLAASLASNIRVYPSSTAFAARGPIPRAAGMVGFHRSRRPGEGGELAGIRKFGPGDRLRRIDWRVSLRTRELHVASTLSDRDAEVVLILDATREAGQSGGIDGFATALDTTVRAAAGIADYYLHHGDRVSFVEYGYAGRRLRPRSGHRHYLTALEWLLDVRPTRAGLEPVPALVDGSQISPTALIIVLTPILDLQAAAMLARFARSGRSVICVDTMPPEVLSAIDSWRSSDSWRKSDDQSGSAARLWRFDRANTIAQLREHGVPVVEWGGAGSLDHVLQLVARMSLLPQVHR